MSRSKASGYVLKRADAPIIMGMVARGDRDHDIAAWFGVNQGRIAEVKDGSKFGTVSAATESQLPAKGPPGVKGRRLREYAENALELLSEGKQADVITLLHKAIADYDSEEQ